MAQTIPLSPTAPIPYDLFRQPDLGMEARRARLLSGIYHHGQARIWDGRETLERLLAEHGPVAVDGPRREALAYVLSVILWGEYAAWRVSAELADRLNTVESRLAATAQAHDEARHFYVLHDYLGALGVAPQTPDRWARILVEMTLRTDELPRKLMGMQMMIEIIALALFRNLREARVCPVLSGLLPYYEQDEARHVGLGTTLLPEVLAPVGPVYHARFRAFLVRLVAAALLELREMEPHLRVLGISSRDVVLVTRDRSFQLRRDLRASGQEDDGPDFANAAIEGIIEALFPTLTRGGGLGARIEGIRAAMRTGLTPLEQRPDYSPTLRF